MPSSTEGKMCDICEVKEAIDECCCGVRYCSVTCQEVHLDEVHGAIMTVGKWDKALRELAEALADEVKLERVAAAGGYRETVNKFEAILRDRMEPLLDAAQGVEKSPYEDCTCEEVKFIQELSKWKS